MMREVRERVDAQKTLRDEVQFQQQAITRISSRVDEVSMEMRAEVPRVSQDQAALRADLDRIVGMHSAFVSRLEVAERSLTEETSARVAAGKNLEEDARKHLSAATVNFGIQLAEVTSRSETLNSMVSSFKD